MLEGGMSKFKNMMLNATGMVALCQLLTCS